MIRATVYLKNAGGNSFMKEAFVPEMPTAGSEWEGRYKVISISSPVPLGTNLSAGEPEMGIRIIVQDNSGESTK